MTRGARKMRAVRKPVWKARKIAKPAEASPSDTLGDFIAAGAQALGLKIEKAWMPAVRTHLEVTIRLGKLVAEYPLPDEAEPAPVFEA